MFKLPGCHQEIETRGFKAKEISLLLNTKKLADGSALNRVMQDCILTPGFKVEDLLLGERMALLIHLRIQTHGPEFFFKAACPSCTNTYMYREDLSQLPVRYLEEPLPHGEDRLHEFTLPVSGAVVKYRYLRGKDEKSMKGLRMNHEDELLQVMMRLRTVEVDGNTLVPLKWFGELEAADSQALFDDMEEHDCGVETNVECTCPHCGSWFDLDIPVLSADFFMPAKRKRSPAFSRED